MKTLSRLLKGFFLLQRFQIHAFMLLLMFSLTSCFQKFYKTNTVSTTDSATLRKLVNENKTFIVHSPDSAFVVKNITLDKDNFSGDREALNPVTEKYMNPFPNDPNHLKMKQSGIVLNEVHLYTTITFPASGKVNLDINHIYRIDVYEFDKKATSKSRTLGIVGITVGAGAIVGAAVIVATSMESSWHNVTWNFH